ncbi:MAG: right-handed parallel beta-helix repeat-containing protein, partial [Blastocatellia bacterium]
SGNYDSSITITKNVTIAAAPGVAAVFSASVANGSIIKFGYDRSSCAAVGECHTLTLRNLIFDGRDVTQDAVRAAEIRLLAEDCTFTRFRFGVLVIGSGQYQFKNCIFQSLETGLKFAPSTDGTIVRSPTLAVVEDCRFAGMSWAGIEMYTGPLGNHTLRAVVRNSLFNRSEVGVISDAGTGGSIQVDLEGCEITNSLAGVVSVYADSTVRVSNSIITGNGMGLSADYGGQLLSRRNNTVENNTANGSFTGFFVAK